MSGSDDPFGRRSLYSRPGGDDEPAPRSGRPPAGAPRGGVDGDAPRSGRAALFSAPAPGQDPERRSRTGIVVECSRCERRRVLDPLTALRHVGPSLWWPLHRPSRYLSCPACGRWAWCRVGLAALGA